MAEYPEKKKYPERQFTAENAMQHYFSTLQEEENDKRAMNIMHNLYLLSPGYAGSSEASYNANQISKGSSTGTAGLATRYRIMGDADKERVSKEFTTLFQDEDFPDMETFYKWTKTMGPWYSETLLRQHEAITKNRVDAMKSTKVGEVVDTLFDEYNDEWLTADYTEQNQVRTNIAESDAIQSLPSKWRSTAIDEIFNRLKGMLAPTGQYAADIEARRVLSAAEATAKHEAALDKERTTTDRKTIARSGAYRLFEYMKAPEEAPGIGLGLSFNEAKDKVTEEMEGTVWDTKVFEDTVKILRKEDAPTPPGTKPVYNPATDSTIFATDAEIADDNTLVPTAAESNLDSTYAHIGAFMAINGDIPNEVWKKYYKGGMDLLYNSLGGEDKEHLLKWLKKVDEYRAKVAAKPTFEMSILYPNPAGQATGQKDTGIISVELVK
jgi:hypothetical protein